MSGTAKEVILNIYEFNSNFDEIDEETKEAISCPITFSFSSNYLVVRETNCNDYHGVACNFEGKFMRLKNNLAKRRKKSNRI